MKLERLKRLDDTKIEVPLDYKEGMRVKGILYVDELLEKELEPQAVEQVANVASLPGIVVSSMAMPDVHTGYGFAIGGVAAFDIREGIVSPGGVGYDINCGVRLLRTNLKKAEAIPKIGELVDTLYREIPSGVGSKGKIRLGPQDQKKILSIKPGVTGLSQITGRDMSFSEEARLELYYIENWSLWKDLYILFKTPFILFKKREAA